MTLGFGAEADFEAQVGFERLDSWVGVKTGAKGTVGFRKSRISWS